MTLDNLDTKWSKLYKEDKDYRPISTSHLTLILSFASRNVPETCLDIGCGTGGLTRELYHIGYSCVGIDASATAIHIANQATTHTESLKYIQGNFETESFSAFKEQSFSLVTCKLVYAFIQDKPAFLKKARSLMRDEGTFILITPVYENGDEPSPIGVERVEVISALEAEFSDVNQVDIGWAMCFICTK